jgi:type I restriction enzyme S subunit
MSNKADKRGWAPKLRFPEFQSAGEWQETPLGKLAKRCTQKNGQVKLSRVLTNSAEFGVVDQRDFFDKDIANQSNLEGYFVVEKGDYVYNPRISATAPVGPISKNNVATGVMSPLYTVFRFNSHNDFYAYYFKTTGWHHYMRQASSTGARHDRMAITNDGFMAMPLPVASHDEQQKVADCLASLDELLTLEAQKLDTLKTHKKGLMQQLFPAEGETLPKLRFPEFRDEGEWEGKLLGAVCDMQAGKFVAASEISEKQAEGLYPCFGGNGLRGYTKTLNQSGRYSLIGRQGALCGNVNLVEGNFYATEHAVVTTPKPGNNTDWLFYNLCLLNLNRFATGQAQPGLSIDVLEKVNCAVPKDEEEQQKIADCLASLDDLITAQTQKLTALKTHKKGMMQHLFPALDEVAA